MSCILSPGNLVGVSVAVFIYLVDISVGVLHSNWLFETGHRDLSC